VLSKLEGRTAESEQFAKETGCKVDQVFISFGWPDFIVLVKSENIEKAKNAIVYLRNLLSRKAGDNCETSSIVCVKKRDIDEMASKLRMLADGSERELASEE